MRTCGETMGKSQVITARKRSCGKVMFSQVSVIPSTWAGGVIYTQSIHSKLDLAVTGRCDKIFVQYTYLNDIGFGEFRRHFREICQVTETQRSVTNYCLIFMF